MSLCCRRQKYDKSDVRTFGGLVDGGLSLAVLEIQYQIPEPVAALSHLCKTR
jgi:hypothetical protein